MGLWLLLFCSWFPTSHIPDGTYKTVAPSYRDNFFLVVKGQQVTLYGWEVNNTKDTLYFRATTLDTSWSLTFDRFDFQRTPVTEKNLNDFRSDNLLNMEPFFLHRYWHEEKTEEGRVQLKAFKDAYDSRVDAFYFEKVTP